MISLRQFKSLAFTVVALIASFGALETAQAQKMEKLTPQQVLKEKSSNSELVQRLLSDFELKPGTNDLIYKPTGELVAWVTVEVQGYTQDGRPLISKISDWQPARVVNESIIRIKLNDSDATSFPDGSNFGYSIDDNGNIILWYSAGNGAPYERVTAQFLRDHPDLRSKFESLGFKFSDGPDGSIIITDDGDRLGKGPGSRITIRDGSRRRPGGSDTIIDDGSGGRRRPGGGVSIFDGDWGDDDGFGDTTIIDDGHSRRRRPGSGDTTIIDDGSSGGRRRSGGGDVSIYDDGGDDGMGRDYGISEFYFDSPDGGRILIRQSDADIVDPKKIAKVRQEFKIGNQTYEFVQVEMPGSFFGWGNEEVIVRKGKNGELYLISKAEHAFIMSVIKNDPKYADLYESLKHYRSDVWDQSDYDNVRANAMKYPKSRAPRGGARIIEYPAGWVDENGSDTIVVRDGGGKGGRASTRVSIEDFIDDYRRSHPDASIEEIQRALNKRYGDGVVIISEAPGGKYRIKYGPHGADADDAVTFIIGDDGYDSDGGDSIRVRDRNRRRSGDGDSISITDGDGSGGRSRMRIRDGSDSNGLDDLDAIIDGMFRGAGRGGVSGGSISISGTTRAFQPKPEKAEIISKYKMRIPILGPGGYSFQYEDLDPNAVEQNADGSFRISAAELARIMAKYPGVDFSLYTTAPGGSSPKSGVPGCPSGNCPAGQTPPSAPQAPAQRSYEILLQEAVAHLIDDELKNGNSVEITHIAGRVVDQRGNTKSTFMTPLKTPYRVNSPSEVDDLLNGIDSKNKSRNGG